MGKWNIRSPRAIAMVVTVAVVAGIALMYALYQPGAAQPQVEAPPPAAVTVAPVVVKPLHAWQEFTGRLQAVDSVEVRPRVNGYIDRVGFADGAVVAKGDLLFQIDPRPYQAEVDRLAAQKQRAASDLTLARADFQRARELRQAEAIASQDYDQFKAAESAAKGELGAIEAMLRAAQLNLAFTQVRAPIAGRVSRANITAGNLVDSTAVLTTVVSQDPVYAYFDVDEQAFLRYTQLMDQGAATDVTGVFMGLVDESGYPHAGTLDFVDNQVNPDTGTIRARARFANADGRYTPGLFARMRLVGGAAADTVLIDDRAVGTDLDKRFVLKLTADDEVIYQRVEMGPSIGGLRVVRSGLERGDVIVVNGLQHVMPGQRVAPQRVSMTADSDALEQLAQVTAHGQELVLVSDDSLPALYIDRARGLVALAGRNQ